MRNIYYKGKFYREKKDNSEKSNCTFCSLFPQCIPSLIYLCKDRENTYLKEDILLDMFALIKEEK